MMIYSRTHLAFLSPNKSHLMSDWSCREMMALTRVKARLCVYTYAHSYTHTHTTHTNTNHPPNDIV